MKLRRQIATLQSFLHQRHEALRFEDIPDPRSARGIRWALPTLLSTAMFSLLLLGRSLRGAEALSKDLSSNRRLRIPRRVPDSTLGDTLARIEPKALREHLYEHIRAEHRRKALAPTVLPIGAASIDGKELAHTTKSWHPDCQEQTGPDGRRHFSMRVLNASLISAAAPVCIDQMPVPASTNEMACFQRFVTGLLAAYGRSGMIEVLVTDSGSTSEANARFVDERQLGYVMALKGNQPDLEREARRVMALRTQQAPDFETHWQSDSSRGVICQQFFRTVEMAGWGAWSHLRQVWLVRTLARPSFAAHGPARLVEDRLYLTNLVVGRLSPEQSLALVRAHWRIENELHGRLDIEWQEDAGRWVRRGNGLLVCALLRALAFNLLALLRAVHLRSAGARAVTWRTLRDWLRDALLQPALREAALEVATAVP